MKIILLLLLFLSFINISAQNKWLKLNGPSGGIITTLITRGDTIIAGTGYNEALIFYSTDRGANWVQADYKTTHYGGSRINAFIFSDDGGIIAADLKNGIYKSFDFIHWKNIFNYNKDYISLGKDINGALYIGTGDGGIFKSSNNGSNWSAMVSGASEAICDFLLAKDTSLLAGSYMAILKKNSNLDTWEPINFQDHNFLENIFADTSNNIFANNNNYIYISSDNGLNWKMQDTNNFFTGTYVYQMLFNNRIIGSCGSNAFQPGWGIIISDDNGLTWRYSNLGLPNGITTYSLTKSFKDTYVGTVGAGVFKSTNFGDSWFSVNNGLNAADCWNINFDNEGSLYSACWSNGVYKSTDKGYSWKILNNGIIDPYMFAVISDNDGILFSSSDQGTFRSIDKGESWNLINNNICNSFSKDDHNRIYGLGEGKGLFRTTDQGNSWTKLDNGFINGYVYSLAIDSNKNIYAGVLGGGIYKSSDDGTTWTNIYQSSNSSSAISSIVVSPNGYIFASNIYEGILRSSDNGLTWQIMNTDAGYQDIYPLGINKKGIIYTSGSNSKFYSSTDNGNTWNDITNNLTFTTVRNIKFDKDDTMYIATDESVWRSNPDSTVGIKNKPIAILHYSLSQNYPNPFNPNTQINYSVKDKGLVKIDIYDILGRKVESLVNEEKQPGNYSITFNAKSITSGVYFYKLEINDYVSVKKMVFLK
jgi:photosystem II stability/assembly factor-like uncharacterized protein